MQTHIPPGAPACAAHQARCLSHDGVSSSGTLTPLGQGSLLAQEGALLKSTLRGSSKAGVPPRALWTFRPDGSLLHWVSSAMKDTEQHP